MGRVGETGVLVRTGGSLGRGTRGSDLAALVGSWPHHLGLKESSVGGFESAALPALHETLVVHYVLGRTVLLLLLLLL